jgi:ribosomal protein L11 methyltransferase
VTASGRHWSVVVARVLPDDADPVSGLMWEAGVAGVEERRCPGEELVELRAGVPTEHAAAVAAALRGAGERLRGGTDVVVVPVEGDADVDRWRDHARPWRAGGRFVVVPAWQERPDWIGADDVVLDIDPGRAFGSGAHPTTRMCLTELERLVGPELAVADIGCGSGVLAVAAARRGAVRVAAIDVDPEAVRATTENAERNGVEHAVCATGAPASSLEPAAYDVVVANIGVGTLVELAPTLGRAVGAEGTIVLSGFLCCQADVVLAAFEAEGFALAGTLADDDWRTLLLRRA